MDRRQGRWAESTRNLERVIELDPRNSYAFQNLSFDYQDLRRYADMAAVLDHALAIAPKDVHMRVECALIDLDWRADSRPLHTTIEAILVEDPGAAATLANHWLVLGLCDHLRMDRRKGSCFAATGDLGINSGWGNLRPTETAPVLGSAPRRSALRKNRRLARTEIVPQLSPPRSVGALHRTATRRALWLPSLSLQRDANFREGMGNGLRLRINRNDGYKPKTTKIIL